MASDPGAAEKGLTFADRLNEKDLALSGTKNSNADSSPSFKTKLSAFLVLGVPSWSVAVISRATSSRRPTLTGTPLTKSAARTSTFARSKRNRDSLST